MEVRCRRCNSDNIILRDSDISFEGIGEKINKKFFCVECGYEFEDIE
jgi:DNA-directed RNA polymerase subunit RPC12/RpoP